MPERNNGPYVDLRDQAVQRVDVRCGGHSHEFCNFGGHHDQYDEEVLRLIDGRIYETPSGRRWRASFGSFYGESKALLTPLGPDTHGFGGVKARYVAPERLEGYDRTWQPTMDWRRNA